MLNHKSLVPTEPIARRLGLKPRDVAEMARLGLIPSVRLGRRLRFDPDQVERWIADGGQQFEGGWRKEPAEAA